MPIERFDFINARKGRLSGKIEEPEVTPIFGALLAHCFIRGKESLTVFRVSRALACAGIGMPRFDVAGPDNGDGDFSNAIFYADKSSTTPANLIVSRLP